MRSLFLRVYIGISIALFVATGSGIVILGRGMIEEFTSKLALVMSRPVREVVEAVDRAGSDEPRRRAALDEFSHDARLDAAVVPIDTVALPAWKVDALRGGQIVAAVGFDAVPRAYGRLPGTTDVVVIELPRIEVHENGRGIVFLGIVFAVLAAGAYSLVRPVERQLASMAGAADRFGSGDLKARADLDQGDAIGHLSAAFDGMADRIERLIKARQSLLHAVSHELRTPLARLRFATELIAGEDSREARTKAAQAMDRDLAELDELVGELLTYGRLNSDTPELDLQAIDLSELVASIAESTRRLAPEHEIEVEPCAETVWCDARLVRRALSNVATNGVRYGGKRLRIGCRIGDDAVELLVDDDGPGIPAEARERVFEPFVRLEPDRLRPGTGLGLAIVRSVLVAHGGTVRIDTSPWGGARFVLSLPRGEGARQQLTARDATA